MGRAKTQRKRSGGRRQTPSPQKPSLPAAVSNFDGRAHLGTPDAGTGPKGAGEKRGRILTVPS